MELHRQRVKRVTVHLQLKQRQATVPHRRKHLEAMEDMELHRQRVKQHMARPKLKHRQHTAPLLH